MKIQNQDIASQAELVAKGASGSDLPNDDKIWVTANSLGKTLKAAIEAGDIGGGGGGGIGDVNTSFSLIAKNIDDISAEFDRKGQNSLLVGGALSGTLSLSTTTSEIILTDNVIKYSGSGQYDYFLKTVDILPADRGNTIKIGFNYNTTSANFKMVARIKDGTAAGVIVSLNLPSVTVPKLASQLMNIPSDCTQIELGFQLNAASASTLYVDGVHLTRDTFTYDTLVKQESILYSGFTSFDGNNNILFKTKSPLSNEGELISSSNSGYTKYTVLKPCQVNIACSISGVGNDRSYRIYHYNSSGTLIERSMQNYSTSVGGTVILMTTKAAIGDYFACYTNTTVDDSVTTYFNITAIAGSPSVLYADSNGSDWVNGGAVGISAVTTSPTKGATTVDKVWWKRDGDEMLVRIEYRQSSAGTSGSGGYLFAIPGGYSIDTTKVTKSNNFGSGSNNGVGSFIAVNESNYNNIVGMVTVYDETRVRLGGQLVGSTYGYVDSGNINLGNTYINYLASFRVPILGWTKTQVVALPASKQNVFSAKFDGANATIINQDSDWISSFVRSSAGQYRVYLKTGLFNIMPTVFVAGRITGNVIVSGESNTNYIQIYAYNDSTTSTVDSVFDLVLIKQGTDYTPPGVYVGNVPKEQVCILKDVKSPGSSGGTNISGTQTRVLNTMEGDLFCSLASNQFVLPAGGYLIEAEVPAFAVDGMRAFLYNVTDAVNQALGTTEYSSNSVPSAGAYSKIRTKFNIASAKTFEIRQFTATVYATYGLGPLGASGSNEVYTTVTIKKIY